MTSINVSDGIVVADFTSIPAGLAAGTGGSVTVTNSGQANVYPTITITAPIRNPTIYNSTTNTIINVEATSNTGDDSLVLDANDYGFYLAPGDNTVYFSAMGGTGTCTLSYYPPVIGV